MIISPKKSLGQNFLIDKNIIEKICNAGNVSQSDTVLEIGPGTGNLTEFILKKKPKKFYIIEKIPKLFFESASILALVIVIFFLVKFKEKPKCRLFHYSIFHVSFFDFSNK